jgi:hypothetical protein
MSSLLQLDPLDNISPLASQLTTARMAYRDADKLDRPASPVDKTPYSSLLSGGPNSTPTMQVAIFL